MAEKFSSNSTKKKVLLLLLAAILICAGYYGCRAILYQIATAGISKETVDTTFLAPREVTLKSDNYQTDHPEVWLDFKDKTELAKGKFGFIRKLELEKKTVITQTVGTGGHVNYGLYRDRSLKDVVDEVDGLKNEEAWTVIEEGGDPDVAASYRYGIKNVVDPGTYYVAVYTEEPDYTERAAYESWYGSILMEDGLSENNYKGFIYAEDGQVMYFRIDAEKAGRIAVDFGINEVGCKVELCDSSKKVIGSAELTPIPNSNSKQQKALLYIKRPGLYYIRISDYPIYDRPEDGDSYKLYAKKIRYMYV